MTNFAFLKKEWPELYRSSIEAEKTVFSSPRTACFYARRTLEQAVTWLYNNDGYLNKPYSDNLGALIHEQTFKDNLSPNLFPKILTIQKVGNLAVHSEKQISDYDSLHVVKELFHFLFWLYRMYSEEKEKVSVNFDTVFIPPKTGPEVTISPKQIQDLEGKLSEKDNALASREEELKKTQQEVELLRQQIQQIKEQNNRIPDTHDYNEAETRDYFIDLLLTEAGWDLKEKDVREYPVVGMPNNSGEGFVDYVLWGDNGLPLGIVEAKRTKKDPRIGQHQAKLYADCLENTKGQRPLIFYTNGYEIYIWDDKNYPPRKISGFYKKDELERLISRRSSIKPLSNSEINTTIAGRYYQVEAIKRVSEAFERKERKSLIVMATGTGKTRTVIALTELLQKYNWVKRILFLADRNALVRQAQKAFKQCINYTDTEIIVNPETTPISRICLSTYPTMLNAIDKTKGGKSVFSPGHFDLIIIDEAHRSVYQKYKAIFDYFDSYLVGLTATPRDEVDKNTYGLFELESGIPTYAYESEQAYQDGYLVRPKAESVPFKFQVDGIKYSDLSEEEKDEYELLFGDEESGILPEKIESSALNKWIINQDTIDKALKYLMENGLKVEGGDRLGKTIIFARNHIHAQYIAERFDKNYPVYKGRFARVIDNYEPYAQSILEDFEDKDKEPIIAISVDMLDTGIDIPEIINLVFFKQVRSKTKFHQMIGRGTRLCPNLFGPGDDKQEFVIFDLCGNFDFFGMYPDGFKAPKHIPLSKKLFLERMALARYLQEQTETNNNLKSLHNELVEQLHQNVSSMNPDNFIVRNKREYVEKYKNKDKWASLSPEDIIELTENISGLPTEMPKEEETAKRFDHLILSLQLALVEKTPNFESLKNKIKDIASSLEEKTSIPKVNEQLELILEIQTDRYWQDVTLPMLENVRKKFRGLISSLDKKGAQEIVYTNFEDSIGMAVAVNISPYEGESGFKQYKLKVEKFLNENLNHLCIHKLRNNIPITPTDIEDLENILFSSQELESKDKFERIYGHQDQLGVFIRKLVGLDREAAKNSFAGYLTGTKFNANQIRFIDQVINYLTQNGTLNPRQLYEPPFTDLNTEGLDGIFGNEDATGIIETINNINKNAVA
jgi:type I restriction enzyme R subunit